MRTLHGAKQSVDTAGRQVVATRWLGEDATFAERPWEPSPNYTGGLKPGEPFYTSDAFPIVWRLNKWTEVFPQDCNGGTAGTDYPTSPPLWWKHLVQMAKYALCYYLFPHACIKRGIHVSGFEHSLLHWWLSSLPWLKKVIYTM